MNESQISMPEPIAQSAAACFETALLEANDAQESFLDGVRAAADASGCSVLVELPALLVDSGARRAIAVTGPGSEEVMLAVQFNEGLPVRVIHGEGLEPGLRDFAQSYAGVLGMLATATPGESALH